ncbi:MAG TPA: Re/Si-specific NAD(P)(+) transhydrogenase subunit alpha [Polyangiales bacterium]|nr:Re/Si-specific NAD(P)(+) transhydrogenase subunit alpha [Polyangiales bacterium]
MPRIFVPKEIAAGETRVACTPETTKRYVKEGFEVVMESGAGAHAHFTDQHYRDAGAKVVSGTEAEDAWSQADIIFRVYPITPEQASKIGEQAILIGFMSPHKNLESVRILRDRKVSTIAMELIPRISRAQTMDALSSQASISGYQAVLLAATYLDKYFPLLMTAAGTIQPAKIVVMGAGVAGLQAIATARRLGAVVEVSDIRPSVKEQVESLGGRFIDFPMDESGEGEGGYARELTPEQLKKQQEVVRKKVVAADAVITTALVPGRPAPKLITKDMVDEMRDGAVIVDLAVEQGGNCELSKSGEMVVEHGVTIIGHPNLPAATPADASLLYSRNIQALLLSMLSDGKVVLDLDDEIIQGALLTHAGEVRHGPTAEAL